MENINQLKASNEELERFAYVASHDLQEPLRKIILFSDQLSVKYKPVLKDEGSDLIDRIMKSSQRMRMLIKNILNFSRSTAQSDAFENTDLNALLSSILSDLEVSISQKNAVVRVGYMPVLPIIPEQFRQLFQNLIINSLKFSADDRAPEIHIYSEKAPSIQLADEKGELYQQGNYNIYIKDNGIGFDPKYAEDIFTLFKRLNNYDKFEGTGIGLSICKKIVEQHNGSISASSDVGAGTTFTISLPFRESLNLQAV